MLRGYRLLILALGLILCAASGPQKPSQQQATNAPTEQASQAAFTPYPDLNAESCYHANDHDRADLCAQWRAALAAEKSTLEAHRATNWAIVGTVLSAIGLGAILWSLGQTERALAASKEANDITRETSIHQLRAYVGFYDWDFEIKITKATFEVSIKNFGQTPALNLQVRRVLTTDKDFSFKDLDFEDMTSIDLHPGNSWDHLKAILDDAPYDQDLHFIAEARYSDIYGQRWALPIRYLKKPYGVWGTVPDVNGSNREYQVQ